MSQSCGNRNSYLVGSTQKVLYGLRVASVVHPLAESKEKETL